jgi:hypothetical protein
MNVNEAIVKIQQAGGNASCVPMTEGNLIYKIVVDGQTVAENLTKEQAQSILDQAKNRVIID